MMLDEILSAIDFERDISPDEQELCQTQAALFEMCQDEFDCDAFDFIRKFMQSDFAAELDVLKELPVEYEDPFKFAEILKGSEWLDGLLPYGNQLDSDALNWIGYLYRYWAWLGTPSREILNIAPVERAYRVYGGLHTLDVREAIRLFVVRQ